MTTKIYLAIVALIYLALAIWCTADSGTTSEKVGFELKGGSGQSEFVAVYGGLEFGMALIFLMPLVWNDSTRFALMACLLIHGSLVIFRTIGYFTFSDIGSFTHRLAAGEWVIFIISVVIWFMQKQSTVDG